MTIPARTRGAQPPSTLPPASQSIPLGTAAWHDGASGVLRRFEIGDLFLGALKDGQEVGFRDDRHALVTAGTRSGKGVSLIIPNLLAWPGSVVVIDPKGENAKVAARRRANGSAYCRGRGQPTCILDPFDEVRTEFDDFADLQGSFNPLDMLSVDKDESVDVAARIAESLIVSENTSDPIWENSAKDALKGVILHVASSPNFTEGERSLVTVQRLLREGDRRAQEIAKLAGEEHGSAMEALFDAMRRNRAFSGVVSAIGAQLGELAVSPRTLAGVLQVVRVNLSFLDSPGMKRVLASSSFALSDLKTAQEGFSLFMSLPQRFVETHCRWLRMMTELIVGEMERVRQRPACGHPVLMVLDEFPALKRMRVLENAAAQIAGYGVKLMFVAQTLAQLKDIYKDNWETFISNAGVKLFFCNDDHFTRKYVSDLIGEVEVVRTGRTSSASQGTSWNDGYSATTGSTVGVSSSSTSTREGTSYTFGHSVNSSASETHSRSQGGSSSYSQGRSESVHKRALVSPDEVGRLFGDRDNPTSLALISGYQPLFVVRAPYFRGLRWGGQFDPHPHHPPPMTYKEYVAEWIRRSKARKEAEERRKRQAEADAQRALIDAAAAERHRRMQAALAEERRAKAARERKWERFKEVCGALFSIAVMFSMWAVPIGGFLWFAIAFARALQNSFS